MFIQPYNNNKTSFCSKVYVTQNAARIMDNYGDNRRKIRSRINDLEKNGDKNVVVFDYDVNKRDVYGTVYDLADDKLCESTYPFEVSFDKREFKFLYKRATLGHKLVKKTAFDNYNIMKSDIEDTLRKMQDAD